MGDFQESIPPTGDRRFDTENIAERYHSNPIEKQFLRLKEVLSPIKNKCLGFLQGNHEYTLSRRMGFDISRRFAEDVLGTEYLSYVALMKLKFAKKDFDLFVTHGAGGAMTLHGQKRKLWKLKNIAQADLYAMGHLHNLIITDDLERREHYGENTTGILINENSQIKWLQPERKPFYIMTSSFFKTYSVDGGSSYGERKLYPPLKIGMVKVEIKDGEIVDAQEIYLD